MSKKHRPRKVVSGSRAAQILALPSSAAAALRRAERMLDNGEWSDAVDELESVRRLHPHRPDVLAPLSDAYQELGDHASQEAVAEELALVDPRPATLANLGYAHMANVHPAMAADAFREYLERWPQHEDAARVREKLQWLSSIVHEVAGPCGLDPEGEGLELAVRNEVVTRLMAEGEMEQALELALELRTSYPCLGAAHNNVTTCCMALSRHEEAAEAARLALERHPENIHALSNLVKLSVLAGDLEAARAYAARLTSSPAKADRKGPKVAEGLTYLGDDEGVLRAYESEGLTPAEHDPILCHLAAVAAARLGRTAEARRLWEYPRGSAELADRVKANLADLDKPASERNGPWAFPLSEWLGQPALADLQAALIRMRDSHTDRPVSDAVREFAEKRPVIVTAVPALLDRGEPAGREVALRLAGAMRTPEMLAALKDFALSDRGTDQQRWEAAGIATEAGLLPREPVRMRVNGEWRQIRHMVWDVTAEPAPSNHSPEVQELLERAIDAISGDDALEAERLLKQALELEPEARDLLNNLSVAYSKQGRDEESEQIVRALFERHPDYLFARVGMAHLLIDEGKLDEAREVLDPLLSLAQLHVTELAALANAEARILSENEDYEGATRWLDIWEGADPDNPVLEGLKLRVGARAMLRWLQEMEKDPSKMGRRRAA